MLSMKTNNKLIRVLHKHLIHEIHEIGWGICKTEGHHCILMESIPGMKCYFGDIRLSNPQLMISRSQFDLGENNGSLHLVEQILDSG
jgi:hypothetical protein